MNPRSKPKVEPKVEPKAKPTYTSKSRFLFCLAILLCAPNVLLAQLGTITFATTANYKIYDSRTGQPVAPGVAVAGLYYSTNLNEIADASLPRDGFQLAAVASVSLSTNEALWGNYFGGTAHLPNTRAGQLVLVQVRVWFAGYATYEDALLDGQDFVGLSAVLGPIALGGGILPTPSLMANGLSPVTIEVSHSTPLPQGQIRLLNMPTHPVLDGETGDSVEPGLAIAGLYFSTDLNAAASPFNPTDTFSLAGTTPVDGAPGFFDGGLVSIPGTVPGQKVMVQLRIWTQEFATYEDAMTNGSQRVAVSAVVGPFELQGAPFSGNSLILSPLGPLILGPPPGPIPPVAQSASYAIRIPTPLTGQLSVLDSTGVPVQFFLFTAPNLGDVILERDGRFTYIPPPATLGVATFRFFAHDGAQASLPVTVTIRILASPTESGGTVLFANSPGTAVIDSTTGQPIAADIVKAGLYYNNDTAAIPNPNIPKDSMELVRVTNVRAGGLFIGGTIAIPGNSPGAPVLLQIRIWSAAYDTYEEAFLTKDTRLGVSNPMTLVTSGGTLPPNTLVIGGGLQPISSGSVPPTPTPTIGITVTPTINLFPDYPNLILISTNNTQANATLDQVLIPFIALDPFQYSWFLDNAVIPFDTRPTTIINLPLGTFSVTLHADDGQVTEIKSVMLEILTAGAAIEELMAQVEASVLDRNQKKPLHAQLKSAFASFERANFKSGLNQLNAFKNSLRAKIGKTNPDIAEHWTALADAIALTFQ